MLKTVLCFHLAYVKWMAKFISLNYYSKRCIYKITFSEQRVTLALGKVDETGQSDNPSESARLCFPTGISAIGASLYQLRNTLQQFKKLSQRLGLTRFQSAWHHSSDAMGMVSDRVRASNPEYASLTRNKSLAEALPDITTAAAKLESIIADIRKFTGAGTLDISHGSMASRTAEGFYKTLVLSME